MHIVQTKGSYSGIHGQTSKFKNGQRLWIDCSPTMNCIWSTDIWKQKLSSNKRCIYQIMRYTMGHPESWRETLPREWEMWPSPKLLVVVQVGPLWGRPVGNRDMFLKKHSYSESSNLSYRYLSKRSKHKCSQKWRIRFVLDGEIRAI